MEGAPPNNANEAAALLERQRAQEARVAVMRARAAAANLQAQKNAENEVNIARMENEARALFNNSDEKVSEPEDNLVMREPTNMTAELLPGFDAYLTRMLEVQNDPGSGDLSTQTMISNLKQSITYHGALLAGGSIVRSMDPESEISDLDIYVPIDKIKSFIDELFNPTTGILRAVYDKPNMRAQSTKFKHIRPSFYCDSFLKKNAIKKVYRAGIRSRFYATTIDIMSVRKRRTPLQVVNNFDLTFCQVWFDGVNIFASHPEDLRKRKGTLQGQYVNLMLNGNIFLKKRMKKYINQGFEIRADPDALVKYGEIKIGGVICPSPVKNKERHKDASFLNRWTMHNFFKWIVDDMPNHPTEQNQTVSKEISDIKMEKGFYPIFIPDITGNSRYKKDIFNGEKTYSDKPSSEYEGLDTEDGYDSEEYESIQKIEELANEKYILPAKYTPELASDLSTQLKFYRYTNLLLQYILNPKSHGSSGLINTYHENLGRLINDDENFGYPYYNLFMTYKLALENRGLRKAPKDYVFANKGDIVFDIHAHPLEAATSKENIEGYLATIPLTVDRNQVPCYWQPGGAAHPEQNCGHKLPLEEVGYMVSNEFFEKYRVPPPQKTGLDQTIGIYDSVLLNAKTRDPLGFGDVFHRTMCPFCLVSEERTEGCVYMTHPNDKQKQLVDAPYCTDNLIVQEIRDKYYSPAVKARIDQILGFSGWKLTFCVECGRPCADHNHFDLNDPPGIIVNPQAPRGGHYRDNYGVCTGGGKPELYARILEIRRVYREDNRRNIMDERKWAAIAADNAPKNDALMVRAQAIFAAPIAERAWNNGPLPLKKKYNDPAYNDVENNNDKNNNGENNGGNSAYVYENNDGKNGEDNGEDAPAGGRRKREKRYRATRKNGKRSQKPTRKH